MAGLRRRIAAVALGAAAVAASTSPAVPSYATGFSCQGGPGPCVIVKVLDGSDAPIATQEYSVAELTSNNMVDATNQDYAFRTSRGGSTPGDFAPEVTSIAQLVKSTQVALSSVGFVEVSDDSSGFVSRLSRDDLANPAQHFENGLVPGVYQVGSGSLTYARPLRNDTDVNFRDKQTADGGGAIEVVVHTAGTLLDVTASAAKQTVMAGKSLTLSAAVSPGEGTAPYTYDWDFVLTDPSQPSTGQSVSHTWKTPGTYYVSVAATDQASPDPNHGLSNYLPIKVTCNPQLDPQDCGATTGGHHPGTSNKPGGNKPSGPSGSNGNQSPQGTHQHHDHAGGPTGHPSTGGPKGSDDPAAPNRASGSHPSDRAKGRQVRASTSSGRAVTGRLLLAAQAYVAPQQKQAATEAAGAHLTPTPHWSWPWRFAGILVLPLLLGLGMVGEAVQVRRRVARMSA